MHATIRIQADVLAAFKKEATRTGMGNQTLINREQSEAALRFSRRVDESQQRATSAANAIGKRTND